MTCPAIIVAAILSSVSPQLHTLTATQNVWDVAAADMNGNGNKDILLLTNDETAFPPHKEVALFLADEQCAYPPRATLRLVLPNEVGAVILAETDGAPPVELIALHAGGAYLYRYTDDGFHLCEQVEFHSLLPSRSREPVFMHNGAKDLRRDGIDEWLIPTADGLEIRTREGLVAAVSCDVVSEMRRSDSVVIVHRLPDYQTFELEAESTLGIAFLSDEFADFAYGDNWAKRRQFRIPMNLEEKWDASAKMGDITGNGFPDLVVTQTRGTVRMESETHVYLASEPFVYPETPNASFTSSGAVSSPVILDVNNNGRLDLVFIRIPFGVKNIVNFFVRGKLSVRSDVYLFDGDRYGDSSDYSTSMTMDAPEGRQRVAYTFGDFNGDGLADVAYGRSEKQFNIYTGDAKRFVSSRPWQSFELPSFGSAAPHDLNGNSAMDIILFRPGGDLATRVDVIVF